MEQPHLRRSRSGIHMRSLLAAGACVVALAACGGTVSDRTTSAVTKAGNKATIERSFDAWRDGTGSPYDLLAETATWTIVGRSIASRISARSVSSTRGVPHAWPLNDA